MLFFYFQENEVEDEDENRGKIFLFFKLAFFIVYIFTPSSLLILRLRIETQNLAKINFHIILISSTLAFEQK